MYERAHFENMTITMSASEGQKKNISKHIFLCSVIALTRRTTFCPRPLRNINNQRRWAWISKRRISRHWISAFQVAILNDSRYTKVLNHCFHLVWRVFYFSFWFLFSSSTHAFYNKKIFLLDSKQSWSCILETINKIIKMLRLSLSALTMKWAKLNAQRA